MTKLFTAGIMTETNTFAPFPSGLADFKEALYLKRGEGIAQAIESDFCRTFIDRALALDWEVATGLRAFAQPAGRVTRATYALLRSELLDDLKAAMPVDAVLLTLHGAMVADGEDDCEGDILRAVRDLVGEDIPVGVQLDPHCHLSDRMVAAADLIHIWKEYPHTDIAVRAGELFDRIQQRLEGAPRPVPVVKECGMTQIFHTTREPMRSFVDRLIALEGRDGIQTISIAHSFPWGDVPTMGTKVLVYADSKSSVDQATALANTLGQELWAMRNEVSIPYISLEGTLELAYQGEAGALVISDGADNPGGGAPCDSTYFLSRLLERGDENWAIGFLYDPGAVRIAMEAGLDAHISLRVGGKTCALSGQPVDITGRVSGIVTNAAMNFSGLAFAVGDAVAIDLGGNRFIGLISQRNQTYSRSLFDELGVALEDKQAVVVKSSQHFYTSFAEIARDIVYAESPGVVTNDFKSLPYQRADTTLWPLANYQQ